MGNAFTESFSKLPDGYNDNRIVLLPRDPYWLFAYWEISDGKRNRFINEFEEMVWKKSTPALKITNLSKNYTYYITVNDFSNTWYINVSDSNSVYVAELGRKISEDFFVNLATSNVVATPNDKIMGTDNIYFVNIKDIKKGKFKLETREIYSKCKFSKITRDFIGTSSLEVLGISSGEMFGVSSLEVFGMNVSMLPEHLGISSETLIR